MATKKKIQYCKNEQCLSCLLLADSQADPDDDESMIITCSLEINKGAEELEDCDSCPSYQPGMNPEDIEPMSEDAVKNAIKSSKKHPDEDKEYEESTRMYTYRGDSLVEVKNPVSGQTSMMLLPSFVEFYNLQVQGQKQAIQAEIDRIMGRQTTILNSLRSMMAEVGDAVTQEDVLLITDPDREELTEDEELADAEMAVGDDTEDEELDEDLDEDEDDDEEEFEGFDDEEDEEDEEDEDEEDED